MKYVEIDAEVGQAFPDHEAVVRGLTPVLEEETEGISAPEVGARWDVVRDREGRPSLRLTFSDGNISVEGLFSRDDLARRPLARRRIIRLWGDMLEIRSHDGVRRLHSMLASTQDG